MYFPTPLTSIVWLRHCRGHAKSPERQSPTCRHENSTQVADNDYGQLAELLRQTSTVKYTRRFDFVFGYLTCYGPTLASYGCVQFFSRPGSEGWPHHGRTFSIYLCPLSFWSTLPRGVLSTSWCCPSRPCVVFLACVHLALFLALSVSSWCGQSMLASLL